MQRMSLSSSVEERGPAVKIHPFVANRPAGQTGSVPLSPVDEAAAGVRSMVSVPSP